MIELPDLRKERLYRSLIGQINHLAPDLAANVLRCPLHALRTTRPNHHLSAKLRSHREKFTLKRYAAAEHITVSTLQGMQSLPDKHISAIGLKRKSAIRLPYFGAALQCLPGTELVLTITSGMRAIAERDPRLRVLDAPKEIVGFHFRMVWHPRLNNDPRHLWLREAVRRTAPKPAAK
jgi:DNA-binding transcriptional LysR family regulator